MLITVATATGQSVRAAAKESWALTLWTYIQLQELESIRRVHAEGDRIDLASLISVGFHEPPKLKEIDHSWRQRARLLLVITKEEALKRGRALAKRILEGGVLKP